MQKIFENNSPNSNPEYPRTRNICVQVMTSEQETIKTRFSHVFHKQFFDNYLQSSHHCLVQTQAGVQAVYQLLCAHLHLLLAGKTTDWYWHFHKKLNQLHWNTFCAAFRDKYKEFDNDVDVLLKMARRP